MSKIVKNKDIGVTVQEDTLNKKISTNRIFLLLNKKDRKTETLLELLAGKKNFQKTSPNSCNISPQGPISCPKSFFIHYFSQ